MSLLTLPKTLRERLGEEASEDLFDLLKEFEKEIKDDLATKKDIKELEVKIKEIELKIEKTKTDLIKWITGLLLAQSTILISGFFIIVKYLLD